MAKFLMTAIQMDLVPNPWRRKHKFTRIVIIKFLSLTYHNSHFLAATFDFTSFHPGFLGLHPFHSLAVLYSLNLHVLKYK